jgi:hypothetical protein
MIEAQATSAAPLPEARTGSDETTDETDLFALGRAAVAAARAAGGGRGVFSRCRQLLASGAWKGPRDAALAYVEEEDAQALGGLAAVEAAGARLFVARTLAAAQEAAGAGFTVYLRLPYRQGEEEATRRRQRAELAARVRDGLAVAGVIPTPEGEPGGLDTLQLVAALRLEVPVARVVADFDRLGHRLAQMSLGFGADELFGPILPERALRLGANAHSTIMTRKEAATLLRGAGLLPCERLSDGRLEEVSE